MYICLHKQINNCTIFIFSSLVKSNRTVLVCIYSITSTCNMMTFVYFVSELVTGIKLNHYVSVDVDSLYCNKRKYLCSHEHYSEGEHKSIFFLHMKSFLFFFKMFSIFLAESFRITSLM